MRRNPRIRGTKRRMREARGGEGEGESGMMRIAMKSPSLLSLSLSLSLSPLLSTKRRREKRRRKAASPPPPFHMQMLYNHFSSRIVGSSLSPPLSPSPPPFRCTHARLAEK